MQTLVEFMAEYSSGGKAFKPPVDINSRWLERIVPQGIDKMGEAGAQYYLDNYSRSATGLDKLVKLARTCEFYGARDLANGFWQAAYEKVHDVPAPRSTPATAAEAHEPPERVAAVPIVQHSALAEFPEALQPGRVVTMQPVDALHTRDYYIASPDYCGQPKRDGKRTVAFVTANLVVTQARSHTVSSLPPAISQELSRVARDLGPFILDGELWYADYQGGEHRTGAQAATVNSEAGQAAIPVVPRYSFFDGLYARGRDLRPSATKHRFQACETIAAKLQGVAHIEYLWPDLDRSSKRHLATRQEAEGREGEVWRLLSAAYTGGKSSADPEPIVRTKYVTERSVLVTGFTPTRATKDPTRRFAAIQVADPDTGQALGEVGTGFSRADQDELLKRFTQGPYLITVASQGTTEGARGKLWLPGFVDFGGNDNA